MVELLWEAFGLDWWGWAALTAPIDKPDMLYIFSGWRFWLRTGADVEWWKAHGRNCRVDGNICQTTRSRGWPSRSNAMEQLLIRWSFVVSLYLFTWDKITTKCEAILHGTTMIPRFCSPDQCESRIDLGRNGRGLVFPGINDDDNHNNHNNHIYVCDDKIHQDDRAVKSKKWNKVGRELPKVNLPTEVRVP